MTPFKVQRQWVDGDIWFVENEFCRMAYVYTDDPSKVGTHAFHGPKQIAVEYIARSNDPGK